MPWRATGEVTLEAATSVDDLYTRVYPKLDVVLLFSEHNEGLPVVLLEAMAHGIVPVVADFRGRAQEGVIRNGETGLVFPVGDLERAASALQALAGQPDRRLRLSRAAQSEVLGQYTVEIMADRVAEALDRAVLLSPNRGTLRPTGLEPQGRLDRWVGVRTAENVRRLLGRRFPHVDASEWPHTGTWPPARLLEIDTQIRRIEEHLAPRPDDRSGAKDRRRDSGLDA
jgi:hypothetical protein